MKNRISPIVIAAYLTSVAACITVNIYFPAPEVRAAAEEIVEETWGPNLPGPSSWLVPHALERPVRLAAAFVRGAVTLLAPREAFAADANIDVSTAAIRVLKESIKQRAGKLKPHLGEGRVGLDKNGMLAARDLSALPLRDQAELRRLIEAENRDRMSLYQEIAKANDFGEERVADIQKIFAETWREKAEPGWSIERADGTWTKR